MADFTRYTSSHYDCCKPILGSKGWFAKHENVCLRNLWRQHASDFIGLYSSYSDKNTDKTIPYKHLQMCRVGLPAAGVGMVEAKVANS